MVQINVLVSSKVRQTAVSQGGTLQSLTVHWKACSGLSGFPEESLLFVSDWEISKTDSVLLMTFIARAEGRNSGASVILPVPGKEKEKRKPTHPHTQHVFSDSKITHKPAFQRDERMWESPRGLLAHFCRDVK